jgi:predicted aconitase with swiveling domain
VTNTEPDGVRLDAVALGTSTASGVLLEAVRRGTAPLALVVSRLDPILVLGLVMADELYGRTRLLVAVEPDQFARLRDGAVAWVDRQGRIRIR